MENFIRIKVSLLENKVNDHFKLASFKLFDVQVNGALSKCCEVTFRGVPWNAGLNNGAKVNVGMDIINTLSKHLGQDELFPKTMPVFVDSAESVTDIIDSDSQIIRLQVNKTIKCKKCNWAGLHGEAIGLMNEDGKIFKSVCPVCSGDVQEHKGLIIR